MTHKEFTDPLTVEERYELDELSLAPFAIVEKDGDTIKLYCPDTGALLAQTKGGNQ